MSMNHKVESWLEKKRYKEPILISKKLSEINDDEWPSNPCLTCRWWVATSPEMNLGECRNSPPRRGSKSPQVPEHPLTPPNHFCRQHWNRDEYYTEGTHAPRRQN